MTEVIQIVEISCIHSIRIIFNVIDFFYRIIKSIVRLININERDGSILNKIFLTFMWVTMAASIKEVMPNAPII